MSYTIERLAEQTRDFEGFPTFKSERWRFSGLSKWLGHPFANEARERIPVDFETPYSLVVENGELVSQNIPDGISIGFECYEGFKHPENPFNMLNAAYAPILCIHIGRSFEGALQIVYQYGSGLRHSRVGIHLDAGAEGNVIERFVGGKESFITHHTAWLLQHGSRLQHTYIQSLEPGAAMVSEASMELETGAYASQSLLAMGSSFSQHFAAVELGRDSEARLHALLLAGERQRQVLCTDFNHRAAQSRSYQLSKQILDGGSVGVFDGKARIDRNATGSEAIQGAHSLLLSADAQVHAKPHLEIYTDDLKASHGATVGQLDEAAMAYLQSRGIPETTARGMMIDAFASEVFEAVEDEDLRDHLKSLTGRGHHAAFL